MAIPSSSDEESDETLIPSSVTNFHFVNRHDEPSCFSSLPCTGIRSSSTVQELYLYGSTEDLLSKVYEPVVKWRLDLGGKLGAVIWVEVRGGKWIRVLRPRKSYEGMIRGVLIVAELLHFVRWNENCSERSVWDHLKRVFDKFEKRPSEEDLWSHFMFMKQFAEQDEELKKSQLLKVLLERKGRRRTGEGNSSADVKESFIAADDEEISLNLNNSDEEEENDLFDSCCCICDNGGDLLCCEGECMRSFHATREAGEESACRSLGLTKAQVDAIQNFLCKNCQVKIHQCFSCGKLGNSDKSKGAEVFQCSNATCGYFYHPSCVAKLLHPDDESKALECETTVLQGKFVCPAHRCYVCNELEVKKKDHDMNFAVCRRCPKSYHIKCLPRKIAVEKDAVARGITTRAWDGLLENRLLIYCLKHKIEEDLGTPIRNHVKFPASFENKEKRLENSKNKSFLEKRKRPLENEESPSERGPSKKRPLETEQKGLKNTVSSPKEQKESQFKRIVKKMPQIELKKGDGSARQVLVPDLPKSSSPKKIVKTSFPVISAETEKKIRELYQKESLNVTMKDVLKRRTVPLTHQNTGRQIEKVARGKIEGSVEAIQQAYQRITEGKSVDDAKALCEPEVVTQVAKWNKRLGVYLSPFLHGMRYTSFGRHFTKEEKLEEIVRKLQWYVQTDDTIVDFCCGSNDFSRLMKQKMDAMGRKCNFKNYDIMCPQDDFCFEKRDWMTVQPKELPSGSSLIMGLNPPFGSKAALANKFIDKALTFRPKLVILIVPKETERLDKKRLGSTRYELVWEDNVSLSGKSFYLPGSVDSNDNQMDQWNVSAPVLYLWSRSDWGARHHDIAEEHAHFSIYSQNDILPHQNGILGEEEKEEMEKSEREAGDIISQVVGDITIFGDENNETNQEIELNGGFFKGKEKVVGDSDVREKAGEKEERERRREKGKEKEEREKKKREKGKGRERESEVKKKKGKERVREGEAMVVGTAEGKEGKLAEEREREHQGKRKVVEQRERESEVVRKLAEERERESEARRLVKERERESEAIRLAEERERESEARRLAEERYREREAKRRAEERERENEAKRRAVEKEKDIEANRRAEERERENEAKRKAEEREREIEAKRKAEEREREKEVKRKAEEREREKEAKKRAEEREREKEAKRRAEEKEAEKKEREKEAQRKLAEKKEQEKEAERKLAEKKEREKEAEERERDLEAKMRLEEREEAKRRLIEGRERETEARRRRLAEEREAQRKLSEEREREERERENEAKKRSEEMERENEAKRKTEEKEEREAKRRAEEKERESKRRISLERERETESKKRLSVERERDSGTHFSRRSSSTSSRERYNSARERNSIGISPSSSRERNNRQSDNPHRIRPSNMEISPVRSNNNRERNPVQNQPIEMRHLDTLDDFSDLGPLFNTNNSEDIDEIARRYVSGPNPSYNWNIRSDFNRVNGSDFLGFDDFDTFGSRPFNNNPYGLSPNPNISSSSLSSLGGTGTGTSGSAIDRYAPRLDQTNFSIDRYGPRLDQTNSITDRYGSRLDQTNLVTDRYGPGLDESNFGTGTSGSAIDRYTPRLDETNFLSRPGPVQGQFGNFGYYENVGALRGEMPPPHSGELGFRARDPYLFVRPPPGSSGGWIND